MNDQILQTPNKMRILNPYRYSVLDAFIESLNPSLWYAARKETAYSDSDSVNIATDFGSIGADAVQGTPAKRPTFKTNAIGGLPAFNFTPPADQRLSVLFVPLVQPYLVISVSKYNDNDAGNHKIYDGYNNALKRATLLTNAGSWLANSGASITDGADDSNDHVFSTLFAGALSYVKKDGTSVVSGNAGTNDLSGFTIGNSYDPPTNQSWDGYISEIIVFNSVPVNSDIEHLEDLLGNAYSITITH